MFREMRRWKQMLNEEACRKILDREPRGILSVCGEDGYPYGIPMNFIYLDGRIYFHSSGEGHKTDALRKDNRVSFCVMDQGYRRENEWALNISSVIVFGKMYPVSDQKRALEVVRALGNKYYPEAKDVEAVIEKAFSRVLLWELTVEHMTGKLVNES